VPARDGATILFDSSIRSGYPDKSVILFFISARNLYLQYPRNLNTRVPEENKSVRSHSSNHCHQ